MATISSTNKGTAMTYETDYMGSVKFKAIAHRDGTKEVFVMREEENCWKVYGLENYETIVSLTKYQLQ